jgi:hypothetical protein
MRSTTKGRKPLTDADRRRLESEGQLRLALEGGDLAEGQQPLPISIKSCVTPTARLEGDDRYPVAASSIRDTLQHVPQKPA